MSDAIDEVLVQLATKGPEFGPGLSNHGPMACDALIALGRGDLVRAWAEWYAPRLGGTPEARNPIGRDGWREALGDISRAGDWSAFFRRELQAAPWREALAAWVPRLLPGIMAGATHGILRTAHAVRSLDREETPQRVAELADGLAYWAARYQELPSIAAPRSSSMPGEALGGVSVLPAEKRGRFLIFDAVRALDAQGFGPVINQVDTSVSLGTFVDDLTRTFARQYLANAPHSAIPFVHTVTAPSALRMLAPHLSAETQRSAMRYAWQACAAVYAAYARPAPAVAQFEPTTPGRDDLADQAVAARDEHAIKFTEACLREHAVSGDPVFLLAAEDAVTRLRVA